MHRFKVHEILLDKKWLNITVCTLFKGIKFHCENYCNNVWTSTKQIGSWSKRNPCWAKILLEEIKKECFKSCSLLHLVLWPWHLKTTSCEERRISRHIKCKSTYLQSLNHKSLNSNYTCLLYISDSAKNGLKLTFGTYFVNVKAWITS